MYIYHSELHSLKCFTKLKTLVMDDNYITSHTTLPPLPLLDTLWVNQNRISNLALFIEAISSTYPNLRFLSMMKNDAAPSYFNNGSKQDYNEYRYIYYTGVDHDLLSINACISSLYSYFVVSQLPKLIALDDTQISDEERSKAVQLYGVPRKRSSSVVKKTAKQVANCWTRGGCELKTESILALVCLNLNPVIHLIFLRNSL